MKEVRFGLIGLGAMGMAHAKTLLGDVPNARLCAAATASQTHAAELLALPGAEDVRIFATPAEMYQSGLIDAVLIATPHRLHVRQAVEAFRAGMHVLLEKPTGVSTQEVRLLNAEADKSGRAFGAMFNQRTNPAYRKMKRLGRTWSSRIGCARRAIMIPARGARRGRRMAAAFCSIRRRTTSICGSGSAACRSASARSAALAAGTTSRLRTT